MTNLFYKNRGTKTIRNKNITDHLFYEISEAIELVYGPEHIGHIYSGGQGRKGVTGSRRTGSVRHDDYGNGGRAADIYIYDKDMNRLSGVSLAPLAQYWAASKLGGVGIEMRGGGIHLDEWSKPPQRGGMFWYYDYDKNSKARTIQRGAIAAGLRGEMPTLYVKPVKRGFALLKLAIAARFGRKRS